MASTAFANWQDTTLQHIIYIPNTRLRGQVHTLFDKLAAPKPYRSVHQTNALAFSQRLNALQWSSRAC